MFQNLFEFEQKFLETIDGSVKKVMETSRNF